MSEKTPPRWLEWAREIQALSQSGLHYSRNEFDCQRYQRLSEISAEMFAAGTDQEYPVLVSLFNSQIGYATPRVDVRAAVIQGGKLLMVRERMDGGWTMPGGWADVGDVPSEAAEREVWEEAGFRVKARKLVGVYDANRSGPLEIFHAYKLLFLCDLIGGEAQTSIETSEVAFFALEEIPAGLSGERTQPRHIVDVFAAYNDPARLANFD
jgi:ADP-ribose pyrophosphatase YjhB (NUDIX family)